ncbi:hypothetical protein [Paenarthrobacter sp. PH39-S1]|uniref:hypothetical protein n=1 Tax=Paenarthrobacter sp. PH39-S1 TaxID=3046204 RepID=UPI0024BB4E38|nr:hypothetical protein [Paenarthrobacter sp. PH39-S1]MDJ0357741.1 hypothetical protein [Paenarthrobacter sp. PH39-S1]
MAPESLNWKIRARVQSEGDAHVMEDTCGFAGPAAWVIDGATSLLEPLGLPGASDPSWLAQTLSIALTEVVAESEPAAPMSESGVRALLAAALQKVDDGGRRSVGEERVRFPSAAVSVARLNDGGVEVLSLADCHVAVRLAGGGIEHVFSELADSRIHAAVPTTGPDPVGLRVRQIADRERRNTADGLWVARREPAAADHAYVVQLPRPELMVMASDGAWRAVDLGLMSDAGEFLEAVSTPVGALELMHRLRAHQRAIGEVADDATVLVVEPADQDQDATRVQLPRR